MSLITITAGPGCQGLKTARLAAQALELELYDDERLAEEARKMGLPEKTLSYFQKRVPGFFQRFFQREPEVFLDLMESLIYKVAQHGAGVIIGHGAPFLLRNFSCAFHVRLRGSEGHRAGRLAENHGLTNGDALKLIRKQDQDQAAFLKYAFRIDIDNPDHYDLTVTVDKLSVETVASSIINIARSNEINACSLTAVEEMNNLSLKKKIEAELLNAGYSLTALHVEVSGGLVSITGLLSGERSSDELQRLVQSLNGVNEVELRLIKAMDMAE